MKNPTVPLLAIILLLSWPTSAAESSEPGPENGGLRLRLGVTPKTVSGKEGYDVRLELINSSKQDITLRAGWWYESDKGDFKDYIEGTTSIESTPSIAPPFGEVQIGNRVSPLPELVLKAGKSLAVNWHADGRHLKNKLYPPSFAHNPEFIFPGLYSVVATLKLNLGDREVLLRSNEQLVPVGGSRAAPKVTFGPLWETNPTNKTATLGLGSLQQVEMGDQFQVEIGRMQTWRLTITNIAPTFSRGRLELMERVKEDPAAYGLPRFPERNMDATLILGNSAIPGALAPQLPARPTQGSAR